MSKGAAVGRHARGLAAGSAWPKLARPCAHCCWVRSEGGGFESITEKIETSSAAGKLIVHVFAALAEFERNLIRERTRTGLTAARARGRADGRKPKLDARQIREIKRLMSDPTIPVGQIAERYKVSQTTICKVAPRSHAAGCWHASECKRGETSLARRLMNTIEHQQII